MAIAERLKIHVRRKLLFTLLIVAALVLNWLPTIDALSQTYLTDTISSNAIVFGVVRTLNGVISVIQSADVGVGVASIGIGEIFDPVNDLIERFSGLLLTTLTALGIQQVILLFTSSFALKVAFSLCAIVVLAILWWAPHSQHKAFKIGLIILILRFILTVEVGFVWAFDWFYFNETGQEALSVLEAATQVLQNLKSTLTQIDISDLIFGSDTPKLANDDISSRIAASVVTLIVGMLFKSLIIPIGTLWVGYKFSQTLMRPIA